MTVVLPESRRPPLDDGPRLPERTHLPDGTAPDGTAPDGRRPRPPWNGSRHEGFWRHWAPMAPAVATLLALCVPFQTGEGDSSGKVTVADAASLVLVVWCLLRLLRGRGGRLTPRAALVLGAPALALAVATAASADPSASMPGFVRGLQIFVLVPGAVLLLLRDARDCRLLCGVFVLVAVVQGVVGVVQNVTGTGASYMGQDIRAVGTFGASDVMGMSTVVSYGLVAALALCLAAPGDSPRWLRRGALCCAAALVVPLVLSYSRGAWIATAAACTVVLLLAALRKALLGLLALAAAMVVLAGGFGVGSSMIEERLGSIVDVNSAPDRSVNDRYSLWSAATGIWLKDPATGVGPRNFATHRDGHAPVGLSSGSDTAGAGSGFSKEPLLSPHNQYLLVLSEQGLIGGVAFVGGGAVLAACCLRRLYAARRAAGCGDTTARPGAADCGLVAVGLVVWQGVDFLYADTGGPSTVATAMVLGTVAWWALAPSTSPSAAGDGVPGAADRVTTADASGRTTGEAPRR